MAKKPPFTVQVKHDGGATGCIRFQVHDRLRATLAFPGTTEPLPGPAGECEDLDLDSLRAGRFVRIDEEGRRRSYQLSRIDRTAILAVPAAEWVSLEERNDGGFRYLEMPEVDGPAVASIQLKPAAPTPAPSVSRGSGLRARAMAAGRPTPSAPSTPQRQVAPSHVPESRTSAVGTALARKALDALDRGEAISNLEAAYSDVDRLQNQVQGLLAQLAESRERESDLLEVLGRWQGRTA